MLLNLHLNLMVVTFVQRLTWHHPVVDVHYVHEMVVTWTPVHCISAHQDNYTRGLDTDRMAAALSTVLFIQILNIFNSNVILCTWLRGVELWITPEIEGSISNSMHLKQISICITFFFLGNWISNNILDRYGKDWLVIQDELEYLSMKLIICWIILLHKIVISIH